MPERVKKALDAAKGRLAKLKTINKKLKIGLAVAGVLILSLIAFLVVRHVNRPYALLYSDLASEDLAAVVS